MDSTGHLCAPVLPACHVQLPSEGIEQSWDKKFTYLDTVGRPVLVLTKSNVVPETRQVICCGLRLHLPWP